MPMPRASLTSSCLLLMLAGSALAGNQPARAPLAPRTDSGLPAETSFDVNGPFDNAGLEKVDIANPRARESWPFTSMTREDIVARERERHLDLLAEAAARTVAPNFATPETPNYFYYWSVPFAMTLDSKRLAVLVEDTIGEDDARRLVESAAITGGVKPMTSRLMGTPSKDGLRRWVMLTLDGDLMNEADAARAINAITAFPGIAFAAPVFLNEEALGGFVHPTPKVLCRVKPELRVAKAHLGVLAEHAKGHTVDIADYALMDGASRLLVNSKSGFDAMALANRLYETGLFAWTEPNLVATARHHTITPNDPRWSNQWHHRQSGGYDMDTDLAWEFYTFGEPNIKTLILDSGIQNNHPDLNVESGRNFTNGEVGGFGSGGPTFECDNHGTGVAGCVAQLGNNARDGIGTAPGSIVRSGKVGNDDEDPDPGESCDPSWSMTADAVINALAWGPGNGIDITNCSFSRWPASPGSEDQFENLAVNFDINHFASTGNDSEEGINWPSRAPYVHAIGNLTSSGARNPTSNWGDGIDFSAPGTSIVSTDRTGWDGYTNNDWTYFSGTSAASPVAAGVAALFKSAYPWTTWSQAYASIGDGCQDTGAPGYDIYYGFGRVRAYQTLADRNIAGDLCSSPIFCFGTSYNPAIIDTTWATNRSGREPLASCEAGGAGESSSIWFFYVPPGDGLLSVNTNGSDYDTVLSIWNGCGELSGTGATLLDVPFQLACDDDSGTGTASQISNLYVDNSNAIYIKVSRYGLSGGGGDLDFNLTFTLTPPPNNFCSDATVIPAGEGTWNPPGYDIDLATRSTCDGGESCGVPGSNQRSVWYSYTPAADGAISISTANSTYDTVLHVYQTAACPLGIVGGGCFLYTSVACDDNSGPGSTSAISNFAVIAGQTYKIKVSERGNSGSGGFLRFSVNKANATIPANNACSAATVLNAAFNSYVLPDIFTMLATQNSCDPDQVCGDPAGDSNSVWYSIVPTEDSLLSVSTFGSSYDTVLSVHKGSCPVGIFFNGNLICTQVPATIACHDDILTNTVRSSSLSNIRLHAGQSYLVMVCDKDSDDEGGTLRLSYTVAPWCKADFNLNGTVSTQDLFDFITAWNAQVNQTGAGLSADINGNGVVSSQDIFDFIELWVTGCN